MSDLLSAEEYYRIGLDVVLNSHKLFEASTQAEADDAVQYLKAMAAECKALAADHEAALERIAELERVATAAYHLLNSDQCVHCGDNWRDPECRVCNLRAAFKMLSPDALDTLASSTYTPLDALTAVKSPAVPTTSEAV